jgi:hypothetical protein
MEEKCKTNPLPAVQKDEISSEKFKTEEEVKR